MKTDQDDAQASRILFLMLVYLWLAGAVSTGVWSGLYELYHPYVDPYWPRTHEEYVVRAIEGGIINAFFYLPGAPILGGFLYALGHLIAWLTRPWRRPACPASA